jgi:thymidylate synthase (FAD)
MPNEVTPSYEILACPDGREMTKLIERAARTCYKSEDKVKGDSDLALVMRLLDSGHMAMIEFGGDITVKFTSNRGFTHELVRHRLTSLAQESTRYCNYAKDKHGKKINVIPVPDKWLNMDTIPTTKRAAKRFRAAFEAAEEYYMELVGMGVPAQIAREVLPIGLKAEICIKANPREWRHIFSLRCSKRAHPRMRELMIPLLHELARNIPLLFDDLVERFPIEDKP